MHQLIGLLGLLLTAAAQQPAPPAGQNAQRSQANPGDAAAVAAACGGEVQRDAFVALPAQRRVAILSCFTREAAARFNRTLPNRVDEATVLDRVSANGTQLSYHYTVNILRTELRPGALEAFIPSVRTRVCAAPDMSMIISVGGSYRYEWNDRAGERIGEYVVSSC